MTALLDIGTDTARAVEAVRAWVQENGPVEPVDVLTLSAVDDDAGLDLGAGPLLRAVLAERVLRLTAHHLVVDGVSWRILLEDLDTAYHQAVRGEPVRLPAKTTSFQQWANRLAEHAGTGGLDGERGYWKIQLAASITAMPPSSVR